MGLWQDCTRGSTFLLLDTSSSRASMGMSMQAGNHTPSVDVPFESIKTSGACGIGAGAKRESLLHTLLR